MAHSLVAQALSWSERLLVPVAGGDLAATGLPRGWVGERLDLLLEAPASASQLELRGTHHAHGEARRALRLRVLVDGHEVAGLELHQPGAFILRAPLPRGLLSPLRLEIQAAPSFVPDEVLGNGDTRRLCFVLEDLRLRA